ncbi:MAG: hypothetical protein AAGE52_24985 [Myxococcota bacterium]
MEVDVMVCPTDQAQGRFPRRPRFNPLAGAVQQESSIRRRTSQIARGTTPMIFFSDIRKQYHDFSVALDSKPTETNCPLVLGLRFDESLLGEDYVFPELGFTQSDGLWVKDSEKYECYVDESERGYLSARELEKWRLYLLQRCVANKVRLRIPDAHLLLSYKDLNNDFLRYCINNLLAIKELIVVFYSTYHAKDQSALYTAIGIIEWPHAWRILFDELARQGSNTKGNIDRFVALIDEQLSDNEIAQTLHSMQLRCDRVAADEVAAKETLLHEIALLASSL